MRRPKAFNKYIVPILRPGRDWLRERLVEAKPLPYFLQPVLKFRDNFPVNQITLDGHHLWPFLRSEIAVTAMLSFIQRRGLRSPFNPHLSQMCHPNNISYEKIQELKTRYGMKSADELPVKPTDFLFFVNMNSVDLIELEGQLYHRLTDPIFEAACKIGSAEKIEVIKAASDNVYKHQRYKHPSTAILPEYLITRGHAERMQCPNKFSQTLNRHIPYLSMSDQRFMEFVDWQMHMVHFYTRILERYQPKAIFCLPYHYNVPLVFAARKLGIKAVEIQHGMMAGENTINYDNWQEIPDEGYTALPDYFWVWGQYEYDRLNKVFGSHRPNMPKPIIGGYQWMDISQGLNASLNQTLTNEIARFPQPRRALFSLQVMSQVPEHVRTLIESTENEILWILRHHPKCRTKLSPSSFRTRNVLISDTVDGAMMAALFSQVDTHFSESSTSVLEADYFGVKNYVCSEGGYENYEQYIREGGIGYSSPENIAIILGELRDAANFTKMQRLHYIQKIDAESPLREILNA